MLAVVCPGQGSQTPGMLTPWLEQPGAETLLNEFSAASGVDLVAHGTTSDEETIRNTAIAQPLIVAASLLALRLIVGDQTAVTEKVAVTAGHSVGEFAATAVSGALTDASAVALVSRRAQLMAVAAGQATTGMAAVVGGTPEEVNAAIEASGLVAANVNSKGQVVAAGSIEGIERLIQNPPTRARVLPLKVAGAFHTPYMQSAFEGFATVAQEWEANDPSLRLLSNSDGLAFTGGSQGFGASADVLSRLATQIVSPVRWDLCQETLAGLGITGLLELAPGGVLTGIAKRSIPGVELFAVKSADDIEAAQAFVATHSN